MKHLESYKPNQLQPKSRLLPWFFKKRWPYDGCDIAWKENHQELINIAVISDACRFFKKPKLYRSV